MNVDEPVLIGRYWHMPDGTTVPRIAGGSEGEGAGGEGEGAGEGAGAGAAETITPAELESLQKEIRSHRAEAAKYRRQLREKEDALGDIDPDKYKELMAKQQEEEQRKLEEKGKYEELMNEHKRRSELQVSSANESLNMWKGRYEEQVVDNVLFSAADKAIDVREAVTLIRANYKFNITDGGDVEIIGRDGNVMLGDDGTVVTPSKLMNTFLEERPHLCKPSNGGTGSRSGGSPSRSSNQSSDPNLKGSSRIAAALKAKYG